MKKDKDATMSIGVKAEIIITRDEVQKTLREQDFKGTIKQVDAVLGTISKTDYTKYFQDMSWDVIIDAIDESGLD